MKIVLRGMSAAASIALLAACGGSSGNAALSKTFNYGAAQAPSSSESSAASSAQTNLSAAAGFSSSPSMEKGEAIFGFATALADGALGGTAYGLAHPSGETISNGLRRAAQITSACVTGGSVEVKRVWTARPAGSTAADFKDVAAKITWTGCNALTVAHST